MADDTPMPGRTEFTAEEERAMRQRSRQSLNGQRPLTTERTVDSLMKGGMLGAVTPTAENEE